MAPATLSCALLYNDVLATSFRGLCGRTLDTDGESWGFAGRRVSERLLTPVLSTAGTRQAAPLLGVTLLTCSTSRGSMPDVTS